MAFWLILLKLLPFVLELVRAIQRKRLTLEATQEMIDDLNKSGAALVLKAQEARANVSHDPADIESDPYNRD